MLEEAVALAARAHAGQDDLAGEPYIFHPLRVMERVRLLDLDEHRNEALIVAVLHDVVEDTDVELEDLGHFGPVVVDAMSAITHYDHESYDLYLDRALAHPIARIVKCADLQDNLDPDRLALLFDSQRDRLLAKYSRAIEELGISV